MSICSSTQYGVMVRIPIPGFRECPVIFPCGCCFKAHVENETELTVSFLDDIQSHTPPSEILKKVKEVFRDTRYMPNTANINRLLYLTTLEDNDEKSVFSESQVEAFQRSVHAANATKRWLIGGFVTGTLLSIGGVIGAFRFFSDWSSENEAEAFTYFACLTTGASLLGYSATGWNPDFASNAANEWQNQETSAYETIEEMAWELISLNQKYPQLAVEIANHLSIKKLNASIKRDDPKCRVNFITSLEQARAAVLKETILRTNLVVNLALQNQELMLRIQNLEQRLDKIEKP